MVTFGVLVCLWAALLGVLGSCGARENNFGETDEGGSDEGVAESSDTGESGGDGIGEDDGEQTMYFDTLDGMEGGGDEGGAEQCEKIDFLFVLDDSGSMLSAQEGLREGLPRLRGVDSDPCGGGGPPCDGRGLRR